MMNTAIEELGCAMGNPTILGAPPTVKVTNGNNQPEVSLVNGSEEDDADTHMAGMPGLTMERNDTIRCKSGVTSANSTTRQ